MTCEYQIRLEVEDQEREIQIQPEAYNQASGGKIRITKNGNYDVTKFQEADVAVDPPTETIEITVNGEYDIADYAKANVAVPLPAGLFNTTIVSDETNASDVLSEQFVNFDAPGMPDEFELNLSVRTASSLFNSWGFKKLKVSGKITGPNAGMSNMFNSCSNLSSLDLSGLDTSAVTNMDSTFAECLELIDLNLSQLNTSSCTSMINTFHRCNSLTSLDLGGLDTTRVTTVYGLLNSCQNLLSADLSGWNTSAVARAVLSFYNCTKLEYLNISGWTSESIRETDRMFAYDSALKAVAIDSPSVFRLTDTSAFQASSIRNGGTGFVYVPDNLVDEYKSATNWSTVADQIKPLSELPQEVKDVFHMA